MRASSAFGGNPPQAADQRQVLGGGEVRVEIRLFGDVADAALVGDRIVGRPKPTSGSPALGSSRPTTMLTVVLFPGSVRGRGSRRSRPDAARSRRGRARGARRSVSSARAPAAWRATGERRGAAGAPTGRSDRRRDQDHRRRRRSGEETLSARARWGFGGGVEPPRRARCHDQRADECEQPMAEVPCAPTAPRSCARDPALCARNRQRSPAAGGRVAARVGEVAASGRRSRAGTPGHSQSPPGRAASRRRRRLVGITLIPGIPAANPAPARPERSRPADRLRPERRRPSRVRR